MAEILIEQENFGRYGAGHGFGSGQLRKLAWTADPIAEADFLKQKYTLNKVDKVYTDLFDLTGALTLTSEGLGIDYVGAASATGQANATPALFAAVNPTLGMRGVMDVSAQCNSADGSRDVYCEVGSTDAGFGNTAGSILEYGTGTGVDSYGTFAAAPVTNNFTVAPLGNGNHRITFVTCPTFQACVKNGGVPVVGATPQLNYGLITVLYLYAAAINTPSGSSIRFKRVAWYPLSR